ncbi:pyruvate:ferredoxin (flavodoxin) oxidoreductase, partial [bacterium]|nr:pyruvate:ferredoxin (flavodoxin) oxidoreductase [bacterium]
MTKKIVTIDGNEAVAHVAHATNEVIAIYPITPSSSMGEISDEKTARGEKNIWGTIPTVSELQSEGGASGAVHGALTTGALSTTFTASQGLMLMLPNMFKIAGELTSTAFHVSARSLACQALSIFGDHSDVMAARSTGFALVASGSIQEIMDFTLLVQAATLESRVPFLHFFDGFRSSHEVQKIEALSFDQMREMIDDNLVFAHRERGMNPENPILRGTSQNPDVYFQGRETVNKYYLATPEIVQKIMNKFAKMTGRKYQLFDYVGASDADRILIAMGSGCEAIDETVEKLNNMGEKVGLIKVRLFRPFSVEHFARAVPKTVKAIAVLDRTKEPGSIGEPLYLDVRTAIGEAMSDGLLDIAKYPKIVGGRYGLGSKEFNAGMIKAVFYNLKNATPKNHFTVGINDDVTNTSLDYDKEFSAEDDKGYRAMFYGLGADGTVGANKNSIKIIGENTDNYVQGYFVYDSKKAGAVTISHLRFGKKPIRSTYLIQKAHFVACHQFSFLERYNLLENALPCGTFLLNSPYNKDEIWDHLPIEVQQQMIDKKLKFYVIDAVALGQKIGLGERINVIMQTAFFKISGIIAEDIFINAIKESIEKTYGKKGEKIVKMNFKAIDAGLESIEEVKIPAKATSNIKMPPIVPDYSPDFVKDVTATIIVGKGDDIPVSKMPVDGTYMTATTQYEKRNVAVFIPEWNPEVCIQCGQCVLICPHAVVRMKVYDPALLSKAPSTFKSTEAKGKELKGMKFTIQIAPEDCTGCATCFNFCPAFSKKDPKVKALKMVDKIPVREDEKENWNFFSSLPEPDSRLYKSTTVKGSQFIRPLFEFSGACGGCGETPYLKLLTQLFGDRLVMGNATGCSSIYGGNLPTTPYCVRSDGRGPTWSNSLFEDSAEFAFGMRLTADKLKEYAQEILDQLILSSGCKSEDCHCDVELLRSLRNASQQSQIEIEEQRNRVIQLKNTIGNCKDPRCKQLVSVAHFLINRSIW